MSDNKFVVGRSEGVAYANNNLQYSQFKQQQSIHIKNNDIKLTQKHFNVIKEALVKMDCYSCQFVDECHKGNKPICAEINIWINKQ